MYEDTTLSVANKDDIQHQIKLNNIALRILAKMIQKGQLARQTLPAGEPPQTKCLFGSTTFLILSNLFNNFTSYPQKSSTSNTWTQDNSSAKFTGTVVLS